MNYVIPTKVKSIKEEERIIRTIPNKLDEKNPIVEKENLGWFLGFEGSFEALYVGKEKPPYEVGEEVDIVIRKKDT